MPTIYSSCFIPVFRFSVSSKKAYVLSEADRRLLFKAVIPVGVTSRQDPNSKRESAISIGALCEIRLMIFDFVNTCVQSYPTPSRILLSLKVFLEIFFSEQEKELQEKLSSSVGFAKVWDNFVHMYLQNQKSSILFHIVPHLISHSPVWNKDLGVK